MLTFVEQKFISVLSVAPDQEQSETDSDDGDRGSTTLE